MALPGRLINDRIEIKRNWSSEVVVEGVITVMAMVFLKRS
jgi:hypothetical protein